MSVNKYALALIVVASSAVGGVMGSLATAATSSSASPAAIAAAVQRVKDSAAESNLTRIASDLETIKNELRVNGLGEKTAAEL